MERILRERVSYGKKLKHFCFYDIILPIKMTDSGGNE